MPVSAKLIHEFSGSLRKRGQDYYRDGLVRIVNASNGFIKAHLQGSMSYDVYLGFRGGNEFFVRCNCLYFDDHGVCEHVWATIRAADKAGYFEQTSLKSFLLLSDFDGDPEASWKASPKKAPSAIQTFPSPPPPPKPPAWQGLITRISNSHTHEHANRSFWPAKRQIIYFVDATNEVRRDGFVLFPESRELKSDGTWTQAKTLNLKQSQITTLPLTEDREILSMLAGSKQHYGWSYGDSWETIPTACQVKHSLACILLPVLARTGRCYLRRSNNISNEDLGNPVAWDDRGPWRLALQMKRSKKGECSIAGILRRNEEQMDLSAAVLVTEGGLVFTTDRVAHLAEDTPFQCLFELRQLREIGVPEPDHAQFLSALLCSPGLPPLEVPEELRYEKVQLTAVPSLRVRPANTEANGKGRLRADLSFVYDGRLVQQDHDTPGWYEPEARRFLARDLEAERASVALLTESGAKFQGPTYWDPKSAWEIAPTKLPHVVRTLLGAGWHVEAEGKVMRRPGALRMEVSSGVDWFELRGEVQYGDTTAQLPELLQALRRGENLVPLGNGDYGVLPEEWLRRFGHVAAMGTPVNGHLRFRSNQAGLLDALLAAQPESSCDETFARVRRELCSFEGIHPAEQPTGFIGQLRDYQREGLGWMHFLRRFSFGGCLADDMGVGKTAQVLALLESRRISREPQSPALPSLVIVPKSLVFNWKLEAARFTPQLRVLDYTGMSRSTAGFSECDLVLTTYGTLRRDALTLKDLEFDYIILDEAQAVKNANSESSKAVRLLRGQHRLALSGTPIENHLGELWTLFEFLNPGMLGTSGAFKLLSGSARNPGEDARRLLASALRPFVLRRTKEQVARELPAKTEQTVYCEMEPLQRKLYSELLQHYRDSLLRRIDVEGMEKSKIQVLEALLRLRQAACHPGLLDPKRKAEPSAKTDVLLAQLSEVVEEGHKALVFSQFTSLLQIVRDRLDEKGLTYEYLDGSTHDRQTRVERFQNEPDCRLFLISLKAGGLGLNLTAAEYVFLLDPWWNPAVEAQAMDRAHRIGQTRQVFAYRLIARDTVEEKVLALQQTKRDLASAIISADNSLIRNLQREDLELLLS